MKNVVRRQTYIIVAITPAVALTNTKQCWWEMIFGMRNKEWKGSGKYDEQQEDEETKSPQRKC